MCFWKKSWGMFANFFACCILQQNKTQLSILDLQGSVQLVALFPQTGPSAYHQLKSKEFRLSIFTLKQIELVVSTWKNIHINIYIYARVKLGEDFLKFRDEKLHNNICKFPNLPVKRSRPLAVLLNFTINLKHPKSSQNQSPNKKWYLFRIWLVVSTPLIGLCGS